VIIPSFSTDEFVDLAMEYQFVFGKKINIFGIEGGSLKRNILEFSLLKRLEISDFV
jgi:tRNA1Val (adenine37-N6)-methyltransferase